MIRPSPDHTTAITPGTWQYTAMAVHSKRITYSSQSACSYHCSEAAHTRRARGLWPKQCATVLLRTQPPAQQLLTWGKNVHGSVSMHLQPPPNIHALRQLPAHHKLTAVQPNSAHPLQLSNTRVWRTQLVCMPSDRPHKIASVVESPSFQLLKASQHSESWQPPPCGSAL